MEIPQLGELELSHKSLINIRHPTRMVLLIVDGIIVAISAIAFPPDTVMYSILSLELFLYN